MWSSTLLGKAVGEVTREKGKKWEEQDKKQLDTKF